MEKTRPPKQNFMDALEVLSIAIKPNSPLESLKIAFLLFVLTGK